MLSTILPEWQAPALTNGGPRLDRADTPGCDGCGLRQHDQISAVRGGGRQANYSVIGIGPMFAAQTRAGGYAATASFQNTAPPGVNRPQTSHCRRSHLDESEKPMYRRLLASMIPPLLLTGCYQSPPPQQTVYVPAAAPTTVPASYTTVYGAAPAPVVEVAPPAPYLGAVWIGGVWAPRPHGWVWVRGHWR